MNRGPYIRIPDTYYTQTVFDGTAPEEGYQGEVPAFFQGEDVVLDLYLNYKGRPVSPEDFRINVICKPNKFSMDYVWFGEFRDGIDLHPDNKPGFYQIWIPSYVTGGKPKDKHGHMYCPFPDGGGSSGPQNSGSGYPGSGTPPAPVPSGPLPQPSPVSPPGSGYTGSGVDFLYRIGGPDFVPGESTPHLGAPGDLPIIPSSPDNGGVTQGPPVLDNSSEDNILPSAGPVGSGYKSSGYLEPYFETAYDVEPYSNEFYYKSEICNKPLPAGTYSLDIRLQAKVNKLGELHDRVFIIKRMHFTLDYSAASPSPDSMGNRFFNPRLPNSYPHPVSALHTSGRGGLSDGSGDCGDRFRRPLIIIEEPSQYISPPMNTNVD